MIEIKNVLFPVDFTESSRKIAPFVKFFVEKWGADLHIIHVMRGSEEFVGFELGGTWFSSFEHELLKGAQKAMGRFLLEEFGEDADIHSEILTGDAVDEILGYSDKNSIDIIVMGTHGRKGLEKVMFGSVAEGIVKGASCPVVTVNPYKVKF